jgi:hypothetical protein
MNNIVAHKPTSVLRIITLPDGSKTNPTGSVVYKGKTYKVIAIFQSTLNKDNFCVLDREDDNYTCNSKNLTAGVLYENFN